MEWNHRNHADTTQRRLKDVDRVTNRTVVELVQKDIDVMSTRKEIVHEYLGYVMRNESKCRLLDSFLIEKAYRKRGPGRRRIS